MNRTEIEKYSAIEELPSIKEMPFSQEPLWIKKYHSKIKIFKYGWWLLMAFVLFVIIATDGNATPLIFSFVPYFFITKFIKNSMEQYYKKLYFRDLSYLESMNHILNYLKNAGIPVFQQVESLMGLMHQYKDIFPEPVKAIEKKLHHHLLILIQQANNIYIDYPHLKSKKNQKKQYR